MSSTEDLIDAEVAWAIEGHPMATFDWGSVPLAAIPALRNSMAEAPSPDIPPTSAVFADHSAPGEGDAPDVALRVHRPTGAADVVRPCVYWIHGGGYMFGSAFDPEPRIHRWVERFGCVVVSPEYRLAPEFPFPAPLDDCYAGLRWVTRHAAELGVDPNQIVVAGPSAGGGLAAGLCLLARDRDEINVAYQLLIYPTLDDRQESASSSMTTVMAPRELLALAWSAFLGDECGGATVSAYAAPARADSLVGLPPTFVGVGTRDVLRDESIDYARRLMEAGVPTELHVYPGAPHGFEVFAPKARISMQLEDTMEDALRRAWSANR